MSLPGPSELARRGLIDKVPPGYWERYGEETTARIRSWAQRPPCTCANAERISAGRCTRCYGYESSS